MAHLNRITLIGNLTKDPEFVTVGDSLKASCRIASNEVYTDRNGERQERAEFHNLVFWRKRAEQAQKILSKGRQIYVEGVSRNREYTDSQGIQRFIHEVEVENFQALGAIPEHQRNQGAHQPQYPQGAPPQGQYPQGAPPQGQYPQGAPPQGHYPQGAPPQGHAQRNAPPQNRNQRQPSAHQPQYPQGAHPAQADYPAYQGGNGRDHYPSAAGPHPPF